MKDNNLYSTIVFMQESEALEAERILNNEGPKQCLKYLMQWDSGEYHELNSNCPFGTSDKLYPFKSKDGDLFVISYNSHLPYIGLTRVF